MKRTPLTLALVGLVSLGAGIAQAVTYSDVDEPFAGYPIRARLRWR